LRPQKKHAEVLAHVESAVVPDERLADEARFFKAWFENPLRTGAVSPSGRFLARMMASYVDPASEGVIIELGPGTGPVTQALIQRGVAPERLVLVEYEQAFCRLLRRRFPRCRVVQGDAYNLPETLANLIDEPVAAVVSSLPLLTRQEPERLALLNQAFAMMGPKGSFIQFTYGMKSPVPKRGKDGRACPFSFEPSPAVWLNLPPARVWVYRNATETSARR
jgi:phosphatidylethanolamine/phosphatidyl-N-methylethanolamine N-methyltransferase